jgi:DNA-binding response OmpR family regulator
MMPGEPGEPGSGSGEPAPRVLVADDDARILELMTVALASQGFEVITAVDGDEALRLALGQKPDLLLLEERLPRRGGIEVCEFLRRDPEEGSVPILLLSPTADADARARALARGADDLVAKPFSPKDLVARVRRLLARAAELREARRRSRHLERELHRAQDDARRAALETRRERRLRESYAGLGRELHRALDPDAVAEALLAAARDRLRAGFAGLLVLDETAERLVPVAVDGDGWERVAGLEAPAGGELVTLLGGLARPAGRRDLERFPELRKELAPFVACGVSLLAALVGPEGVEGLLIADERPDGQPLDPIEVECLAAACDVGGLALHNARRVRAQLDRSLALLSAAHGGGITPVARAEALAIAGQAAQALLVPPRLQAALRHAIALGRWADTPEGLHAVAALAAADATGIAATLGRVLARAEDDFGVAGDDPDLDRAVALSRLGARYAESRSSGLGAATALALALEEARGALDAATEQALRAAARELAAAGIFEGRAA